MNAEQVRMTKADYERIHALVEECALTLVDVLGLFSGVGDASSVLERVGRVMQQTSTWAQAEIDAGRYTVDAPVTFDTEALLKSYEGRTFRVDWRQSLGHLYEDREAEIERRAGMRFAVRGINPYGLVDAEVIDGADIGLHWVFNPDELIEAEADDDE